MAHSSQGLVIPTALVDRLSATTAGSRELDAEIARALSVPVVARWGDYDWRPDGKGVWRSLPDYTRSLNDALALAERVLGEKEALHLLADLLEREHQSDFDLISLSDLPRLLCIAILRAVAAQSPTEQMGE